MFNDSEGLRLSRLADKENNERIITALRKAGVDCVSANYSGYGDSGQFEDVSLEGGSPEGIRISLQEVRHEYDGDTKTYTHWLSEGCSELQSAVESLLYGWVEREHGGYENNEGGAGQIDIDVTTGEVKWSHDDYYQESHTTEHNMRMVK